MTDTQVVVVGAGPAGLMLSHLLHQAGIHSVVLEQRDRAYVESRVRAGVLEHGTVDLLRMAGVGDRLGREGLVHHGVNLQFERRRRRIALSELTGGKAVTVYGQQEVVKDLIAARMAAGGDLRFEVDDVRIEGIEGAAPRIRFRRDGVDDTLSCDVVAGCDGFHGVSRPTIPSGRLRVYEREFPFAWLGILADVAPSTDELIYSYHAAGFAMHSLRSPRINRLYRVWRVQDFSTSMTELLHRHPAMSAFDRRVQQARQDYLFDSEATARTIAENYVGLPLD
jgi:p-hydroxybenzoate 3-monooxygenase